MYMYLTLTGIVAYQKDNGCLVLSFRGDHIEQLCADGQLPSGVRVGYMEGRRPLSPRSRYNYNSIKLRIQCIYMSMHITFPTL